MELSCSGFKYLLLFQPCIYGMMGWDGQHISGSPSWAMGTCLQAVKWPEGTWFNDKIIWNPPILSICCQVFSHHLNPGHIIRLFPRWNHHKNPGENPGNPQIIPDFYIFLSSFDHLPGLGTSGPCAGHSLVALRLGRDGLVTSDPLTILRFCRVSSLTWKFWHSMWHMFWHSIPTFYLTFSSGILFWHSI